MVPRIQPCPRHRDRLSHLRDKTQAEKTIREIEAERPGYFKREDRTLIRAMIINDAKKENDGP